MTNRIVYIYCLLFNETNDNVRYCYIGSTVDTVRRYKQHCRLSKSSEHPTYRVWRKYGLAKYIVFDETTTEQQALLDNNALEQKYFDLYASNGYILTNLQNPNQSTTNTYSMQTLVEHRHKLSASARKHMKLQWQNAEYANAMRTIIRETSNTDEAKTLQSIKTKQYWQNKQYSDKVRNSMRKSRLAYYANETDEHKQNRIMSVRKSKTDDVKLRTSMKVAKIHTFNRKYGTRTVYTYKFDTGQFKAYMNFIIVQGKVTAFVWDTRKICFTCKQDELPPGYVKVRDTYDFIIE